MRERVLDRHQGLTRRDLGAKAIAAVCRDIGGADDFRKAPEPGPDTDRRSSLEQNLAATLDQENGDFALRQRLSRVRERQLVDAILSPCDAVGGYRTARTVRRRAQAHHRA